MPQTSDTSWSFSGPDDSTFTPNAFLQRFNRHVLEHNWDPAKKLESFPLYITPDSDAEDWYKGLDAADKATWPLLEAAFRVGFPQPVRAKETKVEIEREVMDMELKDVDVGVKNDAGVYKHHAFASRMMQRATQAGISTTRSGILTAHAKLPSIIRMKVKDDATDWKVFTDAIMVVDSAYIKEERRTQKELDEKITKTAQSVIGTPSKALARSFAAASLTSPNPPSPYRPTPANNIPPNPFAQAGRPPAARFGSGFVRTTEPSEEQKTIIRRHMASQRVAANDAEWKTQLRKWSTDWGIDTAVSFNTPFPLKPGTSPAGSGKCFGCGKTGHRGDQCPEPNSIIPREKTWRRLCNYTRQRGYGAPVAVNFVTGIDNDLAWVFGEGSVEYDQGNGGGVPN